MAMYLLGLPWLALTLDQHLDLSWLVLERLSWLAWILVPAGAFLALWCVFLFSTEGRGTPNPMAPPTRLVVRGPYLHSRNPMMVGGWLVGFGLAFALGSPSLLVACFLIVVAGSAYVRFIEEPRLEERFGASYLEYRKSVRRWL